MQDVGLVLKTIFGKENRWLSIPVATWLLVVIVSLLDESSITVAGLLATTLVAGGMAAFLRIGMYTEHRGTMIREAISAGILPPEPDFISGLTGHPPTEIGTPEETKQPVTDPKQPVTDPKQTVVEQAKVFWGVMQQVDAELRRAPLEPSETLQDFHVTAIRYAHRQGWSTKRITDAVFTSYGGWNRTDLKVKAAIE